MKRGKFGLQPLGHAIDPIKTREKALEVRLKQAWPLVVGPALVEHTCLLRVRNHTLVMGCWTPELVVQLRKAAENVWPEIQDRLKTMLGVGVLKMEILPCDKPVVEAPKPALQKESKRDPLLAVLEKYKSLNNQPWTRPRS